MEKANNINKTMKRIGLYPCKVQKEATHNMEMDEKNRKSSRLQQITVVKQQKSNFYRSNTSQTSTSMELQTYFQNDNERKTSEDAVAESKIIKIS